MSVANVIWGCVSFALVIVFPIVISGIGIKPYIDLPSFLIVFPGSFLISLMAHGAKKLGAAYKAAVKGGTRSECLAAVEVFKGLQTNFILTGVFTTVIGFIAMMASYNAQSNLIFGAAVAVLTVLYALIGLMFFVSPFRASAAAKAAEAE